MYTSPLQVTVCSSVRKDSGLIYFIIMLLAQQLKINKLGNKKKRGMNINEGSVHRFVLTMGFVAKIQRQETVAKRQLLSIYLHSFLSDILWLIAHPKITSTAGYLGWIMWSVMYLFKHFYGYNLKLKKKKKVDYHQG